MPAYLSQRSLDRLSTCDPRLVRVVRRAEKLSCYDFTVLEGHRSVERQKELFDQGYSKIDGISRKGKHNYNPSLAVDLAPYPVSWDSKELWKFDVLAGAIFAAAEIEGVKIRWGGDWDSDGNRQEHSFLDLPHFELAE